MRKTFLFVVCLLLGLNLFVFANAGDQTCILSGSAPNPPFLPITGTNRALIIFVQFSDDTFGVDTTQGGALCTTDPTTEWPYNRGDIPSWALNTIDSTASGTHTQFSLTDYFCKMSRDRDDGTHGDFHLIGHVYPELVVPEHERSWYENLSNHGYANAFIAVNREILSYVDNNPEGLDLTIYDDYDNGTQTRTSDGNFDMVFINFRFHFGGFGGTSRLDGLSTSGSSTNFGSLEVGGLDIDGSFATGSGIILNGYERKDTAILMAHEYLHRILDAGHYNYVGQFGLMDGIDGSLSMCAYERQQVGWISPREITGDSIDLEISEAITTADLYKISIPNNEYFLIENRQRTFWADVDNGDGNDGCDKKLPGTGLMIAHIDPDNSTKANQLWWERADGSSPTSFGAGSEDDPFKPSTQDQFTPWTNPNSDTRNGTFSDIAVMNISESGSNIITDVLTNSPPAAPQNLQLSGGSYENPVLTWNANTEPDLDRYYIYRATNYSGTPPPLDQFSQIGSTTGTSFTDPDVWIYNNNWHWYYYVKARDVSGHYSSASNVVSTTGFTKQVVLGESLPNTKTFTLYPPYPNPFNPTTTLRYDLPSASRVELMIANLLGQPIRTLVAENQSAGWHSTMWDGRNDQGNQVGSGIYFYRLAVKPEDGSEPFTQMRKMTLLR